MPSEFLQWWGQQLQDCLPDTVRQFWHRRQSTLAIRLSDGELIVAPPDVDEFLALPVASIEEDDLSATAAQAIANLVTPDRIDLTLQPDQFLLRDLALPNAARPHLAETVGYQLSKTTPFSTEDAFFSCGVRENGTGEKPLQAWLVAMPKSPLTAAMALFEQPPPTSPLRLQSVPETGLPITVSLPLTRTNDPEPAKSRLVWIGLLLVWILAGGIHVYQRFDERAQLEALLSDLRGEAAEVVALRDQFDRATAQLSRLDNAKRDNPSSLAILNELTTLLDDNTWLQRLDFDGENLTLAGNAATPAAVIEALEGSVTFDRVRFESLTRDERTSTDRFRIRAHLESRTEAGEL